MTTAPITHATIAAGGTPGAEKPARADDGTEPGQQQRAIGPMFR
jgi:hypothetical protein